MINDGHTKEHQRFRLKNGKQFSKCQKELGFKICRLTLKRLVEIIEHTGHDTHIRTLEYLQVLKGKHRIHKSDDPYIATMLSKYELANADWNGIISVSKIPNDGYYVHPGTSRLSFVDHFPQRVVTVLYWGDEDPLLDYSIPDYKHKGLCEIVKQKTYLEDYNAYIDNVQYWSDYNLDYFSKYKTLHIKKDEMYLDDQIIYKIINNRWHIKSSRGWFNYVDNTTII